MREFFEPRRKRVGVGMLVMACTFAAGWVRSLFIADQLLMISKGRPMIGVLSIDHYFGCAISKSEIETGWPVWTSGSGNTFDESFGDKLRWRCFCFAYAETNYDTIWFAPYWLIVVPLTLLSAYLLLVPLRTKKIKHVEVCVD